MQRYFFLLWAAWSLSSSSQAQPFPSDTATYTLFEPGNISQPKVQEGSPSCSADGNTLVFVRYTDYLNKAPYIAERQGDNWKVRKLPFIDSLYNLAIAPDGSEIFYLVRSKDPGSNLISTSYRISRGPQGWGTPQPFSDSLMRHRAAYFNQAPDGTLYFLMNLEERRGIYFSEPNEDGRYQGPRWLSDAVSPYPSLTFGPIVHSEEDQLIVTRDGLYTEEKKELLGPMGLYHYQRHGLHWDLGRRLEGLPYSTQATVFPDGTLLFKHRGDLYLADLKQWNIDW